MRTPLFRLALLTALAVAALLPLSAMAAGSPTVTGSKPAIEMKATKIGKVIATPGKIAVYYWDTEKKAGGKIRCTGACAAQWPPIYVKGMVTKHPAGVMATFGTIKRGSKMQLTVNGLPAYTYHEDTAGIVLCDNVDGWHAVRA